MIKVILVVGLLLLTGCTDRESTTTSNSTTSAEAPSEDKCTVLAINEDMNLDLVLECDGRAVSGDGVFVFSKTVRGKKMAVLQYTNSHGEESYFNGILAESSNAVELIVDKHYTMSCTLHQAIYEDCTIVAAEL